MKRKKVIEELCELVSITYNSIGDFSKPSDGFCYRCKRIEEGFKVSGIKPRYQNAGHIVEYIRQAVFEKLERDGYNDGMRRSKNAPSNG